MGWSECLYDYLDEREVIPMTALKPKKPSLVDFTSKYSNNDKAVVRQIICGSEIRLFAGVS